ncbi:transcriptional regulator [Pseudoduganella sp. FT25W]|uniref:Transcriptional regulator n=1 Tax=Duganella alba TaxID=2666081 RepID=A0A6L5QA77_9BURK|nr:sugar diacid recognition domain-containing protein [Duganella alba]MRX06559.1 transcriptional regulator [Duganella alba]MRX14953.1 transcriptional regulator [Duganella alba]
MDILSTELAQDIVTRTMRIIPYNVNVMDANGSIIASGNPARIGELHAGALLALAKKLTVEIDDASAKNLHGAQPGINLPLTVHGQLCGAVGLSGAPDDVRQFGELVRLTAEMILEQAQLTGELQRDSRYREAFVLNLINGEHASTADLGAWAHRLGVNFERSHAVYLLEVDEADLQALQLRLQTRVPSALTAAAGPHELAILDFLDGAGHDRQLHALAAILREICPQPHTLTMGIALQGIGGVATSYQSAKTAARIGRSRHPQRRLHSYYDHSLPVLLAGLNTGWQSAQLRAPIEKLGKNKDMLQRTLEAWFAHDGHPAATAEALHIHRNTLDYRLRRIGDITGLDLARLEDRFLLYISVLLSSQ